ncbi:MAG: hypothetical protein ABL982_25185, partial [Vicinamibacterales bacterium]
MRQKTATLFFILVSVCPPVAQRSQAQGPSFPVCVPTAQPAAPPPGGRGLGPPGQGQTAQVPLQRSPRDTTISAIPGVVAS